MKYTVKLLKKEIIAENTLLLTFEKPEEFSYRAGQYVSIKLLDTSLEGEGGTQKCFSLASAPYQDVIEFSMRISESAFKRNIDNLAIGSEIEITPPIGKFVLPDEGGDEALIFLVGGVGITPARSILFQANHDARSEKFYLFYSNRRPEDAAFLEDFKDLQQIDLTVVNTMTNMENSSHTWDGETGFINEAMIRKYVPSYVRHKFYLVGTAGFINAMKGLLQEHGIPNEHILFDNFGGSTPTK